MLKVMSPTGCVHAVSTTTKRGLHKQVKLYATLCNHAGWRYEYYHKWEETAYQVTCKRCLYVINKKIKRKETDWTRARHGCEHRYPHLKHGVMCRNKDYRGTKTIMRKCNALYCLIPDAPAPHMMAKGLVLRTLAQLNKELVQAERTFRLRFKMIAVHCPRRKPAIQDNGYAHMCSDPLLLKKGKDPKFGWACVMDNCPHMFKALVWRSSQKE